MELLLEDRSAVVWQRRSLMQFYVTTEKF